MTDKQKKQTYDRAYWKVNGERLGKLRWIRLLIRRNYPTFWLCDICNKPISLAKGEINRDHNHKTNQFRGWLCRSCNTALGWFERRQERIETYVR